MQFYSSNISSFSQVRAQFASDAEDFHNNYAVNLDSSSHKKNRNNENERRLENSWPVSLGNLKKVSLAKNLRTQLQA